MSGLRVKLAIYIYIKTEHCLKVHISCGKLVQPILHFFLNFTYNNLLQCSKCRIRYLNLKKKLKIFYLCAKH